LENSLSIVTPEFPLGDVALPRWASNVSDFISKMRAALESEHVSQHLPSWIDLIFGFKQSGDAAVKADNLFHPVCYVGSKGSPEEAVDALSLPMEVLETQLQEFGRMPRQLFFEAHPPRLRTPKWPLSKLQDEGQSEPWYKAVRSIARESLEGTLERTDFGAEGQGYVAPAVNGAKTSPPERQAQTQLPGPAAMFQGGELWRSRAGSLSSLRSLNAQVVAPFALSGGITGMASCSTNLYAVGEVSSRRNFRISPMPLSAVAALCETMSHDARVRLERPVDCNLGADIGRLAFVASLKSETIFDDLQQPVACAACSGPLVLGASDQQLMAWDRRSGQPVQGPSDMLGITRSHVLVFFKTRACGTMGSSASCKQVTHLQVEL
ncbi:lvsF, partial [Symbiodinium necroappetens]